MFESVHVEILFYSNKTMPPLWQGNGEKQPKNRL